MERDKPQMGFSHSLEKSNRYCSLSIVNQVWFAVDTDGIWLKV